MTPYQIPSAAVVFGLTPVGLARMTPRWTILGTPPTWPRSPAFLKLKAKLYSGRCFSHQPTHASGTTFSRRRPPPTSRALAVFFNGGPGSPTSGLMFAFNTATQTLDPDAIAGSNNNVITYNTNAVDKIANLLYMTRRRPASLIRCHCPTGPSID